MYANYWNRSSIQLRHLFMTGFMDISWMAVLLHVRNYGIMSTTNASKTLSGPADFAALRKKVLGSQVLCCLVTSDQCEILELLKLRLSSHRNVSFSQRRSSCR
jgi:hypothetical protein